MLDVGPRAPHSRAIPLRAVLGLALLAAVVLVAHRQLLRPLAFGTQDHIDGYIRVLEYSEEWNRGHWAQTLPNAFRGAGNAFPRFYPPVSHVVAGAIYRVVPDPILASHFSGLAAVIVGGLFVALLVHRLTMSPMLAGLASAAYTLFPYVFVQLQVRGAFAEVWATAWYPLVALGGALSGSHGRLHPAYPLGVGLLLLSHSVMALWIVPTLLVITALAQTDRWRAIRHAFLAGVLGAGLAGFHVVSVAMGMSDLRASDPEVLHATAELIELANQTFRLSLLSPFMLPLVILAAVVLVGVSARSRLDTPADRLGLLALGGVCVLTAIMLAPGNAWAWMPGPLRYIQFPIRLLSPIAFLLILAVSLRLRRARGLAFRGQIVLALAVVGGAWLAGGVSPMPRPFDQAAIGTLANNEYSESGFTVDQEYLPRGSDPGQLVRDVIQIRNTVGLSPLLAWDVDVAEPIAIVDKVEAGKVTLPLVKYDFHAPRLADGTPLEATSERGLLTVSVGPGRHTIIVGRIIPTHILAGMALSFCTLLGLVKLGVMRRSRLATGGG